MNKPAAHPQPQPQPHAPPQPKPDDERLEPALSDIVAAETANATALDKAVLTLSSAALGLSLVFSKDLAKPEIAVWVPLLYASWALFIATIAVNIAGLVVALRGFRGQWHLAMGVFRHETHHIDELHNAMAHLRERLHGFNVGQGVLFLIAIIALASYVGVNFNQEAHMANKQTDRPVMAQDAAPAKGFVPNTIERAEPGKGYVAATAKGSNAQQTSAATSMTGTAANTAAAQQSTAASPPAPAKKP